MATIHIMDTTLRDGEQTASVSFTKEEKLSISKFLLTDAKVNSIEVASARVSDGERASVSAICQWAKTRKLLNRIEVLGFIDGHQSIDWIYEAGGRVVNLLCKGSLNHLKYQLKKTPQEHVTEVNEHIAYARSKKMKVNVYLEDFSNGMIQSKKYVHYVLTHLKGADRIMLPDTLGILTPQTTYSYCKELVNKYDHSFDFHAHNDYGLATANTLAAINAGVTRVHTTVNSLGERTGNCSLASIVATVHDHSDFSHEH